MGNDNINVTNIKNETIPVPNVPNVEPITDTQVEKQSALAIETYPQTTTSIAQDQPNDTTTSIADDTPQAAAQPQSQIIDETSEKVQLHSLSDSPDPITRDADQEEQEFIDEVQKEHTN